MQQSTAKDGLLFSPLEFGRVTLANRVVMAPMTRSRAEGGFVPSDMMVTYYAQRASAGLIIAENAAVCPNAHCYVRQPGIYTDDQIRGWARVAHAVHAAGGKIFLQLNHGGRAGHPLNQPVGAEIVGASPIAMQGKRFTDSGGELPTPVPRVMSIAEIAQVVEEFGQAARNAVIAGMDGIELHCSTGYLMDQFLNPRTNHRTDAYGDSVENRARFVVELLESVAHAIGPDRVGIRLSPYNGNNDIAGEYPGMEDTYRLLVSRMNGLGILYQHLKDVSALGGAVFKKPLREEMRMTFKGLTLQNGGFDGQTAEECLVRKGGDAIVFGRAFIGNPDLVQRLRHNWPLESYDRSTVYTPGPKGLTDYLQFAQPA